MGVHGQHCGGPDRQHPRRGNVWNQWWLLGKRGAMEDSAPWGFLEEVWWRCEHVCTAFVLGGGGWRTWERWGTHLEEVLYPSGSHKPL